MPKPRLLVLATLAATNCALAAESYTIDPRHTYPVFEVSHLGYSTQRGRFNKVSGKVRLDPAAETGSIELVIDAESIDMGAADWNEHMKSEDFFQAERFPTLTFSSNRFVFADGKPIAAHGKLTLLGVTRPLTVHLKNFNCGRHPLTRKALCGADATATLLRSEFGMGRYVPAISDEIRIFIPVEAYKDD